MIHSHGMYVRVYVRVCLHDIMCLVLTRVIESCSENMMFTRKCRFYDECNQCVRVCMACAYIVLDQASVGMCGMCMECMFVDWNELVIE